MTSRGATTPLERVFACLPYLLPLVDSIQFAAPLVRQFPVLQPFFIPLLVLRPLTGFPLGLIIFLALFMLVIRNENISHFIRFNTMQAILLDIVIILCSLVLSLLTALQGTLILDTLFSVVFLGTLAAVTYSVVQSVLGRYAEIPTLSDAVYMQVR
jgi:Chloroplast import apparatus Tic20-like